MHSIAIVDRLRSLSNVQHAREFSKRGNTYFYTWWINPTSWLLLLLYTVCVYESSERPGISIFAFTVCDGGGGRGRYTYEAGATLSDRHLHSIQQKSLLNGRVREGEGLRIICNVPLSLSTHPRLH